MVFVKERHDYVTSIAEQPKLMALFALFSDTSFSYPVKDISEIDSIYYSCIWSIKTNSKKDFINHYGKISKRKISANSIAPFIHDNFLIYALIIGVLKFDLEREWLINIVGYKAKNNIKTTFENLLASNYQSKANNQSIVLTFLFNHDKKKINDELLVEAYESITNPDQLNNNDFIRILNYIAFDIVIKFKLPRDADEISRLLEFKARFKKRINIFSYIVYNSLLIFFVYGIYSFFHALPEDSKANINEIAIITGITGFGLLGNIIPKWKTIFHSLMLKAFGYNE